MIGEITTSFNQSGFVKRRCEADSRWLPPDFSECVSKDYQTLFDKVKQRLEKMGLYHSYRCAGHVENYHLSNSLKIIVHQDRKTTKIYMLFISSPRSQFFTIRTDPKPVNNLFIFFLL